jgi:SNF2 family DNA or RNA helicase
MLREEQIDIRRKRAAAEPLRIQNLGRNRVFSDYQVTNPATGGQYRVSIRGFEIGDNSCTCPDFRTNTLGTCKHIEAVLAALSQEAPATIRQRKAAVTQPEVYLSYGEQLRLGLHLPPRHSDQLRDLAARFFDDKGLWKDGNNYTALVKAINDVPEQVTLLSDAMEFIDRETERQEMAQKEQTQLHLLEAGQLDLSLLKVPLYPYQTRGALFLACRGRSILGDDMGLGKTPQTLAAAELLARDRGVERVLVVAPASVKYQWEGEIRKFTERPVQVIDGPTKMRRALYAQPTFYRLVNYEVVLRDLEQLNAWQPDLIVLDEAQRIKNWESKISRAVKKLRSRYAIVLTGTPLENKLEELYSIVQFVDDRRLGPAFQFLHDHRVIDGQGKLVGYRNLDRIREKLQPILLRRTRQEVLSQLPARTDSTVFVELADAQKGPYAEQQTTLARLLAKKYLTEIDRRRILCCLANLRMLCASTFLLDKTTNISPKLEEFAELMGELATEGGHKVVVFSQWELMLRKAAEVLDRLGLVYATLHGGVPGKERKALMDRFRDDPQCKVFLSTDAGGTGLNLQAADTVINLEVPWNPAVLEQRIARVHRLGQHRPVRAINLVTRGTIEERVLKTLDLKRSLFAGVFAGTADEVSFEALGQRAFLDTVRTMIGEEVPEIPTRSVSEAPTAPAAPDGRDALARAGVQFLEALANLCSAAAQAGQTTLQLPLPPAEVLQSSAAAIRVLIDQFSRDPKESTVGQAPPVEQR